MKYLIVSLFVVILFSCTKKEKTDDLDPYYSFYIDSWDLIDWDSKFGDTLFSFSGNCNLNISSGFQVPNTFTPNGNGYNDFFIAKGFDLRTYTASIFDTKGTLLYTVHDTCSKDSNLVRVNILYKINGEYDSESSKTVYRYFPEISKSLKIPPDLIRWDGTYNGKPCPEGFYKVSFSFVTPMGVSQSP